MKKIFKLLMHHLPVTLLALPGCTNERKQVEPTAPPYLYKITSPELWQQSKQGKHLLLTDQDEDFIHLSQDNQLERIIDKFWRSQNKAYVVLKLDVIALPGTLKFEANRPGGDKYYHLYNGNIPLKSVVKIIDT